MPIPRCSIAQQALQHDLRCCARRDIAAANDVGDSGRFVIDDDRELIRDHPIAPAHDRITHVDRWCLRDVDARVVDEDNAAIRKLHAHVARRSSPAPLRQRTSAACVGVRPAAVRRASPARSHRARARTWIEMPSRLQRVERSLVRPGTPALDHGLVPVKAEPCERIDDALRPLRLHARRVEVLEAKDGASAATSCVEPHEQCRQQRPRMGFTGRRWREPRDHARSYEGARVTSRDGGRRCASDPR